jgi:hypothetical protein
VATFPVPHCNTWNQLQRVFYCASNVHLTGPLRHDPSVLEVVAGIDFSGHFLCACGKLAGMEDLRTAMRALKFGTLTLGVLLALYLFAYRITGKRGSDATVEIQVYEHKWQAGLFKTAAVIESAIRHKKIETAYGAFPE